MLRDITLGQYYPGESILYRLDPRVKIIAALLYFTALLLVHDWVGCLIGSLFLMLIICIGQVPLLFMLRGLRMVFFIMIIACAFNIFTTEGPPLVQWSFLSISAEGLRQTGIIIFRLICLIMGSSLLTFTTRPVDLSDGLASLLSPLKRFGLPVQDLALMMSITLRFIPILLQESDQIMKAQMARGANLKSGNPVQRIQNLFPLLVPLCVGAVRTSRDLALAMEARCYQNGGNRTRRYPLAIHRRDIIALSIIMVLLLILIII